MYDAYDDDVYAYDSGWDDVMWDCVSAWLYENDYAYRLGVDDADEHLYFKRKHELADQWYWYQVA